MGKVDSGTGGKLPAARVLVGGLGLGYTAHEALASDRVARVEVVELLQPVISWMRDGLVPLSEVLSRELAADGRLEIRQGDVYADLREPPRTVAAGPGVRNPTSRVRERACACACVHVDP